MNSLTVFIASFFGWCSTVRGGGGCVFHLHPVTHLSLKLNYFGAGSIFWGKKNYDQIDYDVTMTSSLL